MGHGTEHHREQNTGTGYYKGHAPDAEQCENSDQENAKNETSGEDLVSANLGAMTETVVSLHSTIDLLVQKTASMAYHIVAMEEILTEIISANGLSLAPVNARIRERIASGTNNEGDPGLAIDAAASIASLSPRY